MFKKPFNRKTGEQRECKYCGDTFHAKKPIWKCQTCVNAAQKIIETKKDGKPEFDFVFFKAPKIAPFIPDVDEEEGTKIVDPDEETED